MLRLFLRLSRFGFLITAIVFFSGCGGSEPGLIAHKYEGSWNNLPNFSTLSSVGQQTVTSNSIDLAEGLHELRVEYFQAGGSQALELSYQLNEGSITKVPAGMLVHNDDHTLDDSGGSSRDDDSYSDAGGSPVWSQNGSGGCYSGFSDSAHFSRTFKKIGGVKPSVVLNGKKSTVIKVLI